MTSETVHLTHIHLIGMILTLLLIASVGIYTGGKIRSASDFSVGGRKANSALIAGIIMGTLVGGASTVGTAQLAFKYGFSAWWFTLGGGVGCLFLGLFLAYPLRESTLETVPQFLAQCYGNAAEPLAGIFNSLGMFFNVVGQVLAAVALLTATLDIPPLMAAVISVILIICYVSFGGIWGAGIIGIIKLVLIYISMMAAGILALNMAGGFISLKSAFPAYPWFSLFGRGYNKDLAAGFSMLLGIISTQTYIQAIFSGKNVNSSRWGAFISAIMIPPIGLAGIFVGLYMRMNYPDINPVEALPLFVLRYFDPWMAGIIIGTLLIAVIGTGAGLALGIGTILAGIYRAYISPGISDKKQLQLIRLIIVFTMLLTLIFITGRLNDLILKWSFLSMGLRGAAIAFPLLGAIFLKDKIYPQAGIIAIAIGPTAVLLWQIIFPDGCEPLYVGLIASFIILIFGIFIQYKTPSIR